MIDKGSLFPFKEIKLTERYTVGSINLNSCNCIHWNTIGGV